MSQDTEQENPEKEEKELEVMEDELVAELKGDVFKYIDKLSPKQRKNLFRNVVGGLAGNNTYYSKKFALQILPDIQHMMQTEDVLFYPYELYPKWKKRTLWQYINSGYNFIVNHMDPDGVYKKFRERVFITQDEDGVRVVYKDDIAVHTLKAVRVTQDDPRAKSSKLEQMQDANRAEEDEGKTDKATWKQEMFNWMENSVEGDRYPKHDSLDFQIGDDDRINLETMFKDLDAFLFQYNAKTHTFCIRRIA